MPQRAELVSNQQEKKIKADTKSIESAEPIANVHISGRTQVPKTPAAVIALQRTAGNTAVQRLIARPAAGAEEEEEKGIPSAELEDEKEGTPSEGMEEEKEGTSWEGMEEEKEATSWEGMEEEKETAPMWAPQEVKRPHAPPPMKMGEGGVVEEEEKAAPTALVPAAKEEEEEIGIPSARAAAQPAAFVDKGRVDVAPAWWTGSATAGSSGDERLAPTAFTDSGNAGNERVWWTEMNLNGPPWGGRGTVGCGDYTESVAPTYKTSTDAKANTSKAWIQAGTGTFTATRGYHGVNAGVQTGTTVYYITTAAAARINTHEQGHSDQSRTVYQNTLQKAENSHHSEETALAVTGTEAQAKTQLQTFWTQAKTDFVQGDKDANIPISAAGGYKASWDSSEQGTADWYGDYGKQTLSDKKTTYDHYIKCKNETAVE